MPFTKGHRYYPSKKPQHGRGAKTARKIAELSHEVRETIPPKLFVQWHLLVLMGKHPIVGENVNGDMYIEIKTNGGEVPTLDQQHSSIKWLTDRGYGQAANIIQLDAMLHGSGHDATPLAAMSSNALAELNDLFERERAKQLNAGASNETTKLEAPLATNVIDVDDE